jgi:PAS domain S-box-containing protein
MENGKDREHARTMRIELTPEVEQQIRAELKTHKVKRARPRAIVVKKRETLIEQVGGPAFQELLQNIYDAALITRLDGRIVNANERALAFFQCTKESICAQSIPDIVSGAGEDLVGTILQNLENDRFTLIQAYCLRQDGSSFPAEISANRLSLEEMEYLSFFVRDVSLRKARENQLLTGYSAIQNSGSGIALATPEGTVTYANPALRRLMGLAGDGDKTEPFALGEHLEDPDAMAAIVEEIRAGRSWGGELVVLSGDRRGVDVQVSVVPNYNADDELTGMVFSLLDISREREARRKLKIYARELAEKNEQMRNDLAMARDIQLALLPREYPDFSSGQTGRGPLFEFAHTYIPCGLIGGDFFNLIRVSDRRVGLFVADVSGHGMRSALIMATVRGLSEELAGAVDHPHEFLEEMNKAYLSIFNLQEDFTFVTALYGVLDADRHLFTFANAGHPAPLLRKRDGGIHRLTHPEDLTWPALGISPSPGYENLSLSVRPGERLLLFTDGIYEEESAAGEEFGMQGVAQSLSAHGDGSLTELLQGMVADVTVHVSGGRFADDVCLLCAEIRG